MIALVVAVSAGPAFAQRTAGERPDISTDEGGLWAAADKAELQVRQSADIDTDPELNAYVKAVACKVAPEHCDDIRIYVMDRPYFNAQMAPNGYGEVWSGMLLRASDEAELAFVLGHEISHFTQNHSLASFRALKSRGLIDVLFLGALAYSYSRDQEMEADRLGLQSMTKAGYDPEASIDIWQSLLDETAASDFKKVREAPTRSSIFDTHPLESDRIAALKGALDHPGEGEMGRAGYRAIIRPHLSDWLRDDLRRRDFGETLHLINRLAADGEDAGVLSYFEGEAYRQRNDEGDLENAEAAYARAVNAKDAPVEAWRELGEARRKLNDKAGARDAFQTYLAKAPEAEDAWLVEDTLKSLGEA